jgi:hypothetical protein
MRTNAVKVMQQRSGDTPTKTEMDWLFNDAARILYASDERTK